MRIEIVATILLGLLLAGCGGSTIPAAPTSASATSVCDDFGVRKGTPAYDQCIAYQEASAQLYPPRSVPPYRLDQYNNRVDAEGYRVDSMGRRMPVQSPYQLP